MREGEVSVEADTSRTAATHESQSGQEAADDSLGLSIDMLDADRLRAWANNLLVYGADVGQWGDLIHMAGRMQQIATSIEQAVRDIGLLRAHCKSWPVDYAALAVKLDNREGRIARLEDALSAIASPSQTSDYGWWTETARKALGVGASNGD